MKNMKNKLFGMILFSALCSFSAQAATTVSILSKSGESTSYSVSETGKLYFEGDKLMITEKSGAKSVAVDVSTSERSRSSLDQWASRNKLPMPSLSPLSRTR